MTGTTPLAETAGKSFGETLGELFAKSFDADPQAGESVVKSSKTAAAANQPLPFVTASPDTTAIKEIPLPSQTGEQIKSANLPQQPPIETLPQQQAQPPVLNTPLPVKAAPDPAPAPAADTDFLKSITKKEAQPDTAPASSSAVPLVRLTKKDTKEKDTKEKDSSRPKSSADPSQTAVAVPAFTPFAQTDDPRLLRLSIARVSSDGKSTVTGHAVPDAPPAAPESNTGEQAFPKSPVAFEVTIPKASSATDQPRPAASSPDQTRSAAPDYTRPAAEPKPILNTVVAPVEKTAAHAGKNQNAKQQPAETPEANAPAPAAKSTVAAAESVLKPTASAAPARDAAAAAVPADVTAPYPPAVSGKSTGAPSRLSQSAAVADPPQVAAPRPHSIDLKVGADTANQVDVRVSQRAGDVQVTVRTADGNLAQSLRQHLPELSDRLAQNGVSSEIWHPAAAAQSSNDTNNNSQDSRSGADDANSQRQSRHSNGDAPSDQQEQGRGSAWREEFSTAEKEGL